MWWVAAAAAVPYVVSAFQRQPKRPGAPAPVNMPDRSGYVNQTLDMAYNPQNQTWMQASDQAAEQVNRILARQGLAGSSGGAQLQAVTQAKLAQAWMENQAQRQSQALNTAMNYDRGQAQIQQGNNDARFNYDMDLYKEQLQRNANQVQGISNIVNTGVQGYNQNQMMNRYEQMMQPRPVYYGTPGQSSGWQPGPAPQPYAVPAGVQYYDNMGNPYGTTG